MHRRILREQQDAIRLRNRQAERSEQDGDERIALWHTIAAFNVGNVWSADTGQLGYLLLRQLLHFSQPVEGSAHVRHGTEPGHKLLICHLMSLLAGRASMCAARCSPWVGIVLPLTTRPCMVAPTYGL